MRTRSPRAAQVAGWGLTLVVVSLLSLRGWGTFQAGVYQDDAFYLVLARSIALGDRYGLINEPGAPAPTKYPFGFPLLLAPVVRLFPHQLVMPTVVSLAATLGTISLLYWGWPLLSPTTTRWWGLGLASLYGLSPAVVGQTREVLSEPAFTAFLVLALLLAEACVRRPGPRYRAAAALGVVLMFTVFTRWIGVAVCLAALVRILLARKPAPDRLRSVVTILVAGFSGLALILVLTPVDLPQLTPQRHLTELRSPPVRRKLGRPLEPGLEVLAEYASDKIRRVVVPVGGGVRERALGERLGVRDFSTIIGVGVSAMVAVGTWWALRTRALAPSVLLFELFYFGALLLWPSVNVRLLFPLLPFLIFQLLLAVAALGVALERRWPGARRLQRRGGLIVGAALLVISAGKSWVVEDSRRFTGDLGAGATWLAAHSPADAILMAQYPQITYLYSERKTVKLPRAQTAGELDQVLRDRRVDYLLLRPELKWRLDGTRAYDDDTRQTLLPALSELAAQGTLAIVYESPPEEMVRVYRVVRTGALR